MKIDLHVHSHHSNDALSKPETIVARAKAKGLTAVAITDHGTCNAWHELEKLTKKEGLPFVKGEEIKVVENGKIAGEIIGLFMSKEVERGSALEIIDALRQQDAIATIAHPFDIFRNSFKNIDAIAKKVDAIEVFNSRCVTRRFNRKAKDYAESHNLGFTAGSDAHHPSEIGNAFVECKGNSLDDLRKAILKKKTIVAGKKSSPFVHGFTTLAKFNLMRPR